MEFDKTKVYTAVNADALKAGSLIVVGLNLKELELKVENGRYTQALVDVAGKDCADRFGVDDYGCLDSLSYYPLAYLIEPAKEPKYKPFSSVEKAKEAIDKHGGWVGHKTDKSCFLITGYIESGEYGKPVVLVGESCNSFQQLYDCFVFPDDSTPCGELEEY
ncbi:MAG: hypothetical protein P1P65_00715 [Treponema sp.]